MVVLVLAIDLIVDKEELRGTDQFGKDIKIFHKLQEALKRPILIIFFPIFQVDFILKVNLHNLNLYFVKPDERIS